MGKFGKALHGVEIIASGAESLSNIINAMASGELIRSLRGEARKTTTTSAGEVIKEEKVSVGWGGLGLGDEQILASLVHMLSPKKQFVFLAFYGWLKANHPFKYRKLNRFFADKVEREQSKEEAKSFMNTLVEVHNAFGNDHEKTYSEYCEKMPGYTSDSTSDFFTTGLDLVVTKAEMFVTGKDKAGNQIGPDRTQNAQGRLAEEKRKLQAAKDKLAVTKSRR